jgi:hypothetical protein
MKRALWLLTYRRDLREAPLSNGHFDVPRFINGLGWAEGSAFTVRYVLFEYTRLKDMQSPGAILLVSCISSAPMLKSRFEAQGGPTLVVSASVFELLALTCRHSSRDSAVEFDIVTCRRWLGDFI